MHRVLFVDDEPATREALAEIASDAGYLVETAGTGLEALDRLVAATGLPEIVVTDLQMPQMNGLELAAAMRADPRLRAIPVVLCSASAESGALASGGGFRAVIPKPCDVSQLLELLAEIIAAGRTSGNLLCTELLRREHAAIRVEISRLGAQVTRLPAAPPAHQLTEVQALIRWCRTAVLEHDAWEERVLFPVIDARAGGSACRYTEALRRQHGVLAHWTDELDEVANARPFDAHGFAQRFERLLGLLSGHLESEETAVLDLADEAVTDEGFQAEVRKRLGQSAWPASGRER